MKNFIEFYIKESIKISSDDFNEFKNVIVVPREFNIMVRSWLAKQINVVNDEFVIEAIEEIINGLDNNINFKVGINISKYISIYTINGSIYVTSDRSIGLNQIQKMFS